MTDVSTQRSRTDSGNIPYIVIAGGLLAASYLVTRIAMQTGFTVGPFHVMPDDLVMLFLGAIGVFALARRRKLTPGEFTFTCILGLYVVRFVASVPSHGTQAYLDFRGDALAFCTMLYLLEYETNFSRRNLFLAFGILSAATAVIFCGRVIGVFPMDIFSSIDPLEVNTYRVLQADALISGFFSIVCFSFAVLPALKNTGLKYGVIGVAAFVFLIACLQRTMAIAVIASLGLLAFLMFFYRMIGRRQKIILLAGTALLVAGVALAISLSSVLQLLIFTVNTQDNTFAWRVMGWQGLLGEMQFSDFVFGKGNGADMGRWTVNGYVTVQAHNFYVEKLWLGGVPGLTLYLILFAQMTAGLFRVVRRSGDKEERALAVLLIAMLAASLVYFISYSYAVATIVVFGYILAFCRRVAEKYPTDLEFFRARMQSYKDANEPAAETLHRDG